MMSKSICHGRGKVVHRMAKNIFLQVNAMQHLVNYASLKFGLQIDLIVFNHDLFKGKIAFDFEFPV